MRNIRVNMDTVANDLAEQPQENGKRKKQMSKKQLKALEEGG